jgi:hypothetical protein
VGVFWLFDASKVNLDLARSVTAGILAVMLTVGAFAGISAFRQGYGVARSHSLHLGLYEGLSTWLRKNTPPTAVVGSFNAGIVSFYSDREVVNLDGVMNDAAIVAIESKTLGQYIRSAGIQYLADVDGQITTFMDNFAGNEGWRREWKNVYSETFPTFGGASQTRYAILERIDTP